MEVHRKDLAPLAKDAEPSAEDDELRLSVVVLNATPQAQDLHRWRISPARRR